MDRIRRELGSFWEHLPEGALDHDQNAYVKKTDKARVMQAAQG